MTALKIHYKNRSATNIKKIANVFLIALTAIPSLAKSESGSSKCASSWVGPTMMVLNQTKQQCLAFKSTGRLSPDTDCDIHSIPVCMPVPNSICLVSAQWKNDDGTNDFYAMGFTSTTDGCTEPNPDEETPADPTSDPVSDAPPKSPC